MNDDFPPTPPAHILAKCDTILQDLVIQQRHLNETFADGWPTSNRSAVNTPNPGMSHSCQDPGPGDFVESLISHMVQSPLRRAPLGRVATKSNDGPLSNAGPIDSTSLRRSPRVEAKTKYSMISSFVVVVVVCRHRSSLSFDVRRCCLSSSFVIVVCRRRPSSSAFFVVVVCRHRL